MDSESDQEEDTVLWKETEALLFQVSTLQEEVTRRTEALMFRLKEEWILTCHQASLEDVRSTGKVTFGHRLLASFRS